MSGPALHTWRPGGGPPWLSRGWRVRGAQRRVRGEPSRVARTSVATMHDACTVSHALIAAMQAGVAAAMAACSSLPTAAAWSLVETIMSL